MPLSKRQKRRLLEVSKMIESSTVVLGEMEGIQLDYANEINDVVEMIRQGDQKPKQLSQSSTDLSVYKSSSPSSGAKATNNSNSTGEGKERNERKFESPKIANGLDAPEWAKKLWKQIAKQCHPDRLSFLELTAMEIAKRQTWFLEARELFQKQLWSKLLHIGVQLGEFVDDLPSSTQLKMLNKEYSGITSKVETIQGSLAWQWGTNWDNIEIRLKILIACLSAKSIKCPSRLELIKIIVNLESE